MRAELVLMILVMLVGVQESVAQYDEYCHYECANVYCDPYSDYCDYDCYEVCYPYRSLTNSGLLATKLGSRSLRPPPTGSLLTQYGAKTPPLQSGFTKLGGNLEGKGIRMKIQRTPNSPRRAGSQNRAGWRPDNFALFESCISGRARPDESTGSLMP